MKWPDQYQILHIVVSLDVVVENIIDFVEKVVVLIEEVVIVVFVVTYSLPNLDFR